MLNPRTILLVFSLCTPLGAQVAEYVLCKLEMGLVLFNNAADVRQRLAGRH